MSELMQSAHDASPVLTDGFRIHVDKRSGNGVIRAMQPGRSPNPTYKLMDISANDVRKELEGILVLHSLNNCI